MTTHLPKGIVTNSSTLRGGIRDIELVDVADLVKLWRVYTTNKDVLVRDQGRRLENLFWRILGNDAIRGTITGATLAAVFMRIADDTVRELPRTRSEMALSTGDDWH